MKEPASIDVQPAAFLRGEKIVQPADLSPCCDAPLAPEGQHYVCGRCRRVCETCCDGGG